jgi:hypothetical protein
MIQIPNPLTQEGPTSRQIGRKLARLFATMRKLEPAAKPAKTARFRNRMTAFELWDASSDKF